MRDKKGLMTFEIDLDTMEVKEAHWQRGSIFCTYSATHGGMTTETFILTQRPNCRYIQALNITNAKRKAKNL